VNEAAWQQQVIDLATLYGWEHYHSFDSRRSVPGWPDLVLVRPPELVIVELKTDTGRLTAPQRNWLALLSGCGAETHVWRPSDFDEVHERLKWPWARQAA
jgi:hypothetical protein